MPSNQCTNSLMELSFAVGNMLGSESCDRSDYVQLGNILDAYDCSKRGDAGKKLSQIKKKLTMLLPTDNVPPLAVLIFIASKYGQRTMN